MPTGTWGGDDFWADPDITWGGEGAPAAGGGSDTPAPIPDSPPSRRHTGKYTYYVGDALTGEVWDELPFSTFHFVRTLNRAGSWDATIPLREEKITAQRGLLTPNRTAVWVDLDGVILFGGVLDSPAALVENNELSVGGKSWWGYWRDRRVVRSQQGMTHTAGAGSVIYRPSGDDVNDNLVGVPDNTDLFNNVAPDIPDSLRYIRSTNPGTVPQYLARFAVPGGDLAAFEIASVTVSAYMLTMVPRPVRLRVRIDNHDYDGPTIWDVHNTAHATLISETWETNPSNGEAWTAADVQAFANSSAAGVWTGPSALDDEMRLYMLYITVTYGPSDIVVFDQVDQALIVNDLLDHAQSYLGTLPLSVVLRGPEPGGLSGIDRDRTFDTFGRPFVGALIEQLASIIDGIEFGIDWAWVNGKPTPVFNLDYPRRGRITDLIFEVGKNVTVLDYTADGTKQATRLDEIGEGSGMDTLLATAVAPDIYPAGGRPLLEATKSRKTVKELATLQGHADADLAAARDPVVTMKVRITGDVDSQLGAFIEGDSATISADVGWLSVHGTARIQQFDVNIDVNRNVNIELDLATANDDLVDDDEAAF